MAALDGALALAEVDDRPLPVADELDLDVARLLDKLLDVEPAVAEGVGGLGPGGHEERLELGLVAGHPHPAPAAAGRRLDHDREAGLARCGEPLLHTLHGAVGAGDDGDACLLHRLLGDGLVAHLRDRLGRRPDEDEVVVVADAGELRVLAQEPVARVDRVGARDLGRRDDRRDVEVALRGRRGPDAHGLVGELHRERVAVGRGVHGDRLEPHLAAGPDDAERDLAAVGDEDFLDHGEARRDGRGRTKGPATGPRAARITARSRRAAGRTRRARRSWRGSA